MDIFNVAILGCGTVGGGVARILLDNSETLRLRAGKQIKLVKILDLFPENASKRHSIPRSLFCGDMNCTELSKDEASNLIDSLINDKSIDLIIETIGGSSSFMVDLIAKIIQSGKHIVTANKSLLAQNIKLIIDLAKNNNRAVGFEASVCGAIPIIKGINECFTGDNIKSLSGIMNGTSNFILTKMNLDNLSFDTALKEAQNLGYAEADPTLDINGWDAGHKLIILMKIIYGINIGINELSVLGIDTITESDTYFAREINSVIKLICYSKFTQEGLYATVRPMMVRKQNFLSEINNATNAVKVFGEYSKENILVGQGAGSLETGSAIVSDVVFIARYGVTSLHDYQMPHIKLLPFTELDMPYTIIFETADRPGITGLITTAIGKQNINIDTVSHNVRNRNISGAIFSVATSPCKYSQIELAIQDINSSDPGIFVKKPKIIPILD